MKPKDYLHIGLMVGGVTGAAWGSVALFYRLTEFDPLSLELFPPVLHVSDGVQDIAERVIDADDSLGVWKRTHCTGAGIEFVVHDGNMNGRFDDVDSLVIGRNLSDVFSPETYEFVTDGQKPNEVQSVNYHKRVEQAKRAGYGGEDLYNRIKTKRSDFLRRARDCLR